MSADPVECKACGKRAPEYFKCPKCGADVVKIVEESTTRFYYLCGDSWLTEEGDEETGFSIYYQCTEEKCGWNNMEGAHDHG